MMDEDEDDAVEVSLTAPWTVLAVTINPGELRHCLRCWSSTWSNTTEGASSEVDLKTLDCVVAAKPSR